MWFGRIKFVPYDLWIMGAVVAGIVAFLIVRKLREE